MRAILWFLSVAAILSTIIEEGSCAPKINGTSARNVTVSPRNASEPGNPIHFLVVADRTKRTRREAEEYDDAPAPESVCQSYKFVQPNEAKGSVFSAGYDIYKHTLGICLAVVGGELTPGKYREDLGACLVPWGSKEHRLTTGFEVLTMPQPKYFSWLRLQNGQVPPHTMAWGRASDGKPKYVARCHTHLFGKNTLVPGNIHNGKMYFPFHWKEHVCDEASVEVLTCTGAGSEEPKDYA